MQNFFKKKANGFPKSSAGNGFLERDRVHETVLRLESQRRLDIIPNGQQAKQ